MLVENLVLAQKKKKWGEKKAASAPETEGPLSHQFTPLPTPSSAPNLLCCSRCSSPGFQRAVAPPQGVAESMASSCRNIATLLVVPAEPPTATHLPPLPSQDVQAERANCREQGAPPSQEHLHILHTNSPPAHPPHRPDRPTHRSNSQTHADGSRQFSRGVTAWARRYTLPATTTHHQEAGPAAPIASWKPHHQGALSKLPQVTWSGWWGSSLRGFWRPL